MKRLHLSEANLRLFLILDALLETGSVTRAAERVGLSQPAVSHALKKLREIYGDELLVRNGAGMEPTPLALELKPQLRFGLAELERAMNRDRSFDPATSRRVFSLATVDYALMTAFGRALARVRREAPGVDVRVRPLRPELAEALAAGTLDTVFAGGEVERQLALDGELMRSCMAREPFRCILRADHPGVGEALDLDTYCALPHALVSTGGADRGMVDEALAKLGRKRRVAVTVPHFVGAVHAVADSDLVAMVPRGLAEYGRAHFGLRVLAPPLEVPPGTAYLWWHRRFHDDPGHRWWRTLLLEEYATERTDQLARSMMVSDEASNAPAARP